MAKEVRTLTYLRAFAAWLVVFFHFYHLFPANHGWQIPIVKDGGIAVDIFFVLSGYVLAHVYTAAITAGSFSYRDFLIKRLARIYPVHLFTMLAAIVLALSYSAYKTGQLGFSLAGQTIEISVLLILYQTLLLHASGIFQTGVLNAPSWSISAEWFAYLLFPLSFALVNRFRNFRTFPITIILFCILLESATVVFFDRSLLELGSEGGMLRILPSFIFGIYLRLTPQPALIARRPAILLVVAFGWLWLALPYGLLSLCLPPIGLGVAALAALEGTINHNSNSARALGYLGHISYSTYMVHYFALFFVGPLIKRFGAHALPASLVAVVYIFAVYSFSALAFHFVEVPAREWILNRQRLKSSGSISA